MKNVYGGIFFITFGFLALILFFISLKNSKPTKTWPNINGKVLESEVEKSRGGGNASARILYEYTVDGKKYTSERIRAFGISKFHFAESPTLVEEFPAGKEVSVFYNPKDPSSAVLLHGPPKNIYVFIIGIIVVFLLGLFIIMQQYIKKQEKIEDDTVCQIQS